MKFWRDKQNVNGKDSATPSAILGKNSDGDVGSATMGHGFVVTGGDVHVGPFPAPGIEVFAGPQGSDVTGNGTYTSPYATGYRAYQDIVAAGGGILYLYDLADWGGPVTGGGIWHRDDAVPVPGFLKAVQSKIVGIGGAPSNFMGRPGVARVYCGSNAPADHRTKPGVWLTTSYQSIVQFENIQPVAAVGGGGTNRGDRLICPWRIGMDYVRFIDGSPTDGAIAYLQITSAVRTSAATGSGFSWTPGSTTFTVTLPAGYAVTSASRSGTTVTLAIPQPVNPSGPACPQWENQSPFWFQSNDPTHYPSGAYTVTNPQFGLDPTLQWGFDYVDAGAPALTVASPGVVRSAQVVPGEYIDVESSDANFPSSQYRVTAVSVTSSTTATITVADYSGGTNGVPGTATGGAIGQLVKQERALSHVVPMVIENCYGSTPELPYTDFIYRSGPTFDFGGCNAGQVTMNQCMISGYGPTPASNLPYDEDRMSAVFGYGGVNGFANIDMQECVGTQVEVRWICGNGCQVTLDYLADTDSGFPPPVYHITGSNECRISIVRAELADAISGGDPIIDGTVDPLLISGSYLPLATSAYGPPTKGIGTTTAWKNGQIPETPWVHLKVGSWAGGRITGRHPAAERGGPLAVARYANLVGDPSVWNTLGGTAPTIGVPDPFGGNSAVRITDATGDVIINAAEHMPFFAVGGRFVIAGWVNMHSAAANAGFWLEYFFRGTGTFSPIGPSDLIWASSGNDSWSHQFDATVTGWQWIVSWDDVVSGTANQYCDMVIRGAAPSSGSYVDYFGMTAFWVPPGFDQNDLAEYLYTLRAQSRVVAPGHVSTLEDVRLVAHGGLGMDSSVLTTPSGTATPTKNVPIYGADGTTVIAWVPALPSDSNLNYQAPITWPANGDVVYISGGAPAGNSGFTFTGTELIVPDTVKLSGVTAGSLIATDTGGFVAPVTVDSPLSYNGVTGHLGISGVVTSVGAAAPVTSSGGTTPSIGINDFVGSGASHARGAVPDPGATAGTTRFLREDGTWAVAAPKRVAITYFLWSLALNSTSLGGWLLTNDRSGIYASPAMEYPVPFVATKVWASVNLIANSIPIGPSLVVGVTRNGSNIIGATAPVGSTDPTGSQVYGPTSTGSTSDLDVYGLYLSWGGSSGSGSCTVAYTVYLEEY